MNRRMACIYCERVDDVVDHEGGKRTRQGGRIGGWYVCECCERAVGT